MPALPQTGLEVRPTQTVYTFAEGELKATLTWSTPKLPEDLEVFSRPVTYVTARVTGAKNWKLNAAISPALATNDDKAPMVTNTCTVADLPAMSIGRREQTPLSRSGDRVRCDWGYAWLVGPSAVLDGEAHVLLAYDDVKSIQFFNDDLPAWWRRNGLSFEAMLEQAESDRVALLRKLDAFDAEFSADLLKLGGEDYARLGALAYRQSFAACKLVADKNNQPLYFSKENASNGCIGTVDVFYPQFPHLLLMSPTLARATLAPILIYASHPRWPWPFAPHDVGQYPLANKQCYAGGETGKDETKLMPVEECGNMLVCLGALAHMEGNADFAGGWWPTVTKWAEYLAKFGFDPGNQLCTDDFAGHLAHNANLAVKTVMGLASYAKMAEMRGETEVAAKYNALARDMVPKWIEAAKGGREGSYRLRSTRFVEHEVQSRVGPHPRLQPLPAGSCRSGDEGLSCAHPAIWTSSRQPQDLDENGLGNLVRDAPQPQGGRRVHQRRHLPIPRQDAGPHPVQRLVLGGLREVPRLHRPQCHRRGLHSRALRSGDVEEVLVPRHVDDSTLCAVEGPVRPSYEVRRPRGTHLGQHSVAVHA